MWLPDMNTKIINVLLLCVFVIVTSTLGRTWALSDPDETDVGENTLERRVRSVSLGDEELTKDLEQEERAQSVERSVTLDEEEVSKITDVEDEIENEINERERRSLRMGEDEMEEFAADAGKRNNPYFSVNQDSRLQAAELKRQRVERSMRNLQR